MAIRLIASDMDGTFLDARGGYDRERFVAILDELEKRGIPFVVATGNGMKRLEYMFGDLLPRLTFVAENGAQLVENGETIFRYTISPALVAEFLDYFEGKEREYKINLTGEEKSYFLSGTQFPIFEAVEPEQLAMFHANMAYVDSWDEVEHETIYKISLIVPEEECDIITREFNKVFEGRLTAVTSGYGAVDILISGIHKAWGLQKVLERHGISLREVMSFGDSDNDLEMLTLSGYSYAMANASERVKAIAKYLAPHHDESGVLTIIEEFLGE